MNVLEKVGSTKIDVNGQEMSIKEVIARTVYADALKGDMQAIKLVLGRSEESTANQQDVAEKLKEVANFLKTYYKKEEEK